MIFVGFGVDFCLFGIFVDKGCTKDGFLLFVVFVLFIGIVVYFNGIIYVIE